jgi:hypothetical protein
MDLKEIQNLIKFVANSGVAEVKLETGDIKITIRTTLEGGSLDVTYVQQAPMLQQALHNNWLQLQLQHQLHQLQHDRRQFKIHYYKITNDWNFLQKTSSR